MTLIQSEESKVDPQMAVSRTHRTAQKVCFPLHSLPRYTPLDMVPVLLQGDAHQLTSSMDAGL